jgi:SNF2 family DNA or RNA helicase
MRYQLLDDALVDAIAESSPADQNDWLFLSESQEFPGYWVVDGIDEEFFYDFEDLLGRYCLVSPVRINALLTEAEELHYKTAFVQSPEHILAQYEALKEDPPVSLHSTLENTTRGFLPWQVIGFNKLIKSDIPAGLAIWLTGSGKTALIAASIMWRLERKEVDLALVVVKAHNKIETQRKLKSLGGINSIIVRGDEDGRFDVYTEIEERLDRGEPTVVITNYETFRNDEGVFAALVNKRRCLFFWDEMPTKLSNRETKLYKAVKSALYKSFISKPRPSWMRHLVLSATPVENDPDGLFSYVNLVHPWILGTVNDFQNEHVASRNWISGKPERWIDLDKIEAKLDFMTSRVSKADPEVAKMFPEMIRDERVIDWNPKHRAAYNRFTDAAKDILNEGDSGINVLSMIQVLQMLCDAPSMVVQSAANREAFSRLLSAREDQDGDVLGPGDARGSEAAVRLLSMVDVSKLTDTGHTKLDVMREIIMEKHPEEKVVVHSTWANYIFPVWTTWLKHWEIPFVIYSGTEKQKQLALDRFRDDPLIRVFLSGDAGADSIDIAEASVGISYNGAWKATTMQQREGRRDRVTSTFKTIYSYDLAMADSVEDRKREVRVQKQGYHDAIFEGRAVEGALSAKMTQADLLYMLLGDSDLLT